MLHIFLFQALLLIEVHRSVSSCEVKPNEITGIIVDEAYRLHSEIGPGLLESVYEVRYVIASKQEAFGFGARFPCRFASTE